MGKRKLLAGTESGEQGAKYFAITLQQKYSYSH